MYQSLYCVVKILLEFKDQQICAANLFVLKLIIC